MKQAMYIIALPDTYNEVFPLGDSNFSPFFRVFFLSLLLNSKAIDAKPSRRHIRLALQSIADTLSHSF